MHGSHPGSGPAEDAKKPLSPKMTAAAQGSAIPQSSRRVMKRTKPPPELSQPTHTTQSVARPISTSPVKSFKGRVPAATVNHQKMEIDEQNRPLPHQPVIAPQLHVMQVSPTFSGNFDLYGTYLPSLAKLSLPPGAMTPNYSTVYDRILSSQARHDYTARCFLAPPDASSAAPPHGRFESASILDPTAGRPFDIILDSFTYKKSLTFTPTERMSFQAPEQSIPGPGIVGHGRLLPTCGIKSAKGVFKIKRVWTKQQDGLANELFEGFFSFGVSYDSVYRKAAHGSGATYKFAFWGVRAMKDNTGKEIGLGPGKAVG